MTPAAVSGTLSGAAAPAGTAGNIVLTPHSITGVVDGTPYPAFTASESGYSGSFTARLKSGYCILVAPNGTYNTDGSVVAPDGKFEVGIASVKLCIVSVSDTKSHTATLWVHGKPGPFKTSNSLLQLQGTGSANKQSFTLSGGVPPYSADGYDKTLIAVARDKIDRTMFWVTPLKAGKTTLNAHDSHGGTVHVKIGVTTVGGGIH